MASSEIPVQVLIIEDKKSDAELFEKKLREEGYHVEVVDNAEDGLTRAREGAFDVVLTDLHLSGWDRLAGEGLDIIRHLHYAKPYLSVILMTGLPTTTATIEAIKFGACDSIIKGSKLNWHEIKAKIKKAAEMSRRQRDKQTRVLIIEDKKSDADLFENRLKEEGYDVEIADNAEDGLARAREGAFDVVLTDLHLSGSAELGGEGLEIIKELRSAKPHLSVILMTGLPTTTTTIEAMKIGAYDSIIKGSKINWHEFTAKIRKASEISRLQREPAQERPTVPREGDFQIIGNSPIMHEVYKQIGLLAGTPVTVLIRGETGTGKELVAHALHEHSGKRGPFVPVNCAAIPENLLESELFGHEAGAFTGAVTQKIGRFEEAHGGTIFLDEVGDMTLDHQVKLLRVLQEKKIRRLGGKLAIPVDVRVVAATNRDLALAIMEKEFREDLYYRLNVAIINLPPLRDRREDIPDLVEHFLARAAGPPITDGAIKLLQEQSWPGNVRQLSSVIGRASIRGHTITAEEIRAALKEPDSALPISAAHDSLASLVTDLLSKAAREQLTNVQTVFTDAVERELYNQALKLAGNQLQAAKWLGVSRTTMREKLIRFGLHPASSSELSRENVGREE